MKLLFGLAMLAAGASAADPALYEQFAPLYREALERREETLGPEHPKSLQARQDLANFLVGHGRPGEAAELLRRVVEARQSRREAAGLAGSLEDLADALFAEGKGDEARAALERALSVREEAAQPPEAFAGAWERLLAIATATGDLERAHELAERLVETTPSVERFLRLAGVQEALGRAEAAAASYERTIALAGPEQAPTAAIARNNLALLALAAGDASRAERLLTEALALYERTIGTENPDAAFALDNLGNVRRSAGDLIAAEKLFRRALALRRRLFGGEHPDVAVTLNNLAGALHLAGRLDEAEPLYREALEMQRKLLGAADPSAAQTAANLGYLLAAQGRRAEAVQLFGEAIAALEPVYGAADPLVEELSRARARLLNAP